MSIVKVAVLGAGNMGRALVGGLIRRGLRPEQLTVGESLAGAREIVETEFQVRAYADNAAAIAAAEIVILAVKPQQAGAVLQPLGALLRRNRALLISIAAGIRLTALERWCGAGVPIVRAMPNTPALVGAGATALYAEGQVVPEQRSNAEAVLKSVGEVVWVDSEDALDLVTALSGSGPAYFFLLAELMSRAAAAQGLNAETARKLAIATLHGAGRLAHDGDGDLERLRASITSPGGTTAAAVQAFEDAGLATIVAAALAAAARRGRELAQLYGN